MNAVDQFGQATISEGPVKFLYTEVWSEHPGYMSLKQIIDHNNRLSNHTLNTVLAAYINYELSNTPGQFNTPGVLFANAVIFAAGGAHISLGENMLSKEYFPHQNLQLTSELENKLINYYDFLVAYQNLLRDGAQETKLNINTDSEYKILTMPAIGNIWAFSKHKDQRDIIHLINFTHAKHLRWNDTDGDQSEPPVLEDLTLSVSIDRAVHNVWYATPDSHYGSAIALPFTQDEGVVTFILPSLEYWDMVVLE